MAGVRHGIAEWPGAKSVVSCTYTCSHGVVPGVAVLTILPQDGYPAPAGNLLFTDGVGGAVVVRDMKVDRIEASSGPGGTVWQLVLIDRRWKWKFGAVSASYNALNPTGEILPWTRKLPTEVCRLLLHEMGEDGAEVFVPNAELPPVEWDSVVPSAALETFAGSLGCRVIYDPVGDRVAVAPLGVGGSLPNAESIAEESPGYDSPERPDAVGVIGGPILFDMFVPLEPVGIDVDGRIYHIDDLSYKPDRGWDQSGPPTWSEVALPYRDLAARSVFKMWRVRIPADGLAIPGRPDKIRRREQVILCDQRLTVTAGVVQDTGLPAAVYAKKWDAKRLKPDQGTGGLVLEGVELPVDVSVDQARGVVTLSQPVWDIEQTPGVPGGRVKRAELYFAGCVMIRDERTNAVIRYRKELLYGVQSFGTKPEYTVRDDLVAWVVAQYPFYPEITGDVRYCSNASCYRYVRDFQTIESVVTNAERVERMATYYLKMQAAQYQVSGSQRGKYNGIIPVRLDGALQQVTWSVGPDGAFTEASVNSEHAPYVPKFPRRVQRSRRLLDESPEPEMPLTGLFKVSAAQG